MEKLLLRKEMKRLRREMDAKERTIKDEKIFKNLTGLGKFKDQKWFYIYVSYGTEADTKKIIEQLLSLKQKEEIHIAVPKVLGDEMEFYEINSLSELKKGCMGILEPENDDRESVDIKALNDSEEAKKAVMILPGLAFDIEHSRLGYGGGFYDKYLDRYGADNFLKIAICYDFQVLKYDNIEICDNDIKADMIVTDKAYY